MALVSALLHAIADAAAVLLLHMTRLQGHGLNCRLQWCKAVQQLVFQDCPAFSVARHEVAASALGVSMQVTQALKRLWRGQGPTSVAKRPAPLPMTRRAASLPAMPGPGTPRTRARGLAAT